MAVGDACLWLTSKLVECDRRVSVNAASDNAFVAREKARLETNQLPATNDLLSVIFPRLKKQFPLAGAGIVASAYRKYFEAICARGEEIF